MNYKKEPLGWIIEEDVFDPRRTGKCESIFAQGNGYMNIRCTLEESYVGERRGAFITGTFNKALPDEVTELPNLPDVTEMKILVNGERFAMDAGKVEGYSRTFDLRTGEAVRVLDWTSPAGVTLRFSFRRFVSLKNEHLAAFRMEVTPLSGDVDLVIESGISSRTSNSGSQHCAEGEKRLVEGGALRLMTRTTQSDVPVVVHCLHKFTPAPAASLPVMERRRFVNRYTFHVAKDETLSMEKLAAYHTGRDVVFTSYGQPAGSTNAMQVCAAGDACIAKAAGRSYEDLLAESAACWKPYWDEQDVVIESEDPFDQLGMRFALYHLNIMIRRDDSRVGIGAKGMTGEGYKGHSFWDTEMFLMPHYLFTDPKAARTLLEYRWRSLPGAFKKAEENGYSGAMFPWESAWLDDGEVTPLIGGADIVTGKSTPILTGMIEHHISADVSWGVWLYYLATGDDSYMDQCGCEILVETARFWSSRVEWQEDKGRYEIRDVIGPDEYKEHVDNNAFTNYLTAENLDRACDVIAQMREKWPNAYATLSAKYDLDALTAQFKDVRAKLYLPQPNADGIIAQNDQYLGLEKIDLSKYKAQTGVSSIYEDYSPHQMNQMMVSKQADLVMLLRVMPDLFDADTLRKNFLFYESRTLHDSSLSHGQHCVLASWLGLDEMALNMYRHAIDIDLGPNMSSSDEGIHSASMGNVWQCAVCGFAGLQWHADHLSLDNHLPACWKRLAFRVHYRGAVLRVEMTHDNMHITKLSGPSVKLVVNGVEDTL